MKFSPLGQIFNTGLDKNAQGYQEEGIIKLLKDLAGNVIIPARPPGPDNDGNYNNGNDNNGNDDNGNDDNGNDLSWMNGLQLYKKNCFRSFF